MSKVFILGVSHVRSFVNDMLIPIYLGPGSNVNLFDGFKNLNDKIDKVLFKKIHNDNDIILLQIGEESVRYIFRNELYPHVLNNNLWNKVYDDDIKAINSGSGKKKIDILVEKYIQLINKYKTQIPNLYILSAITSFNPINEALIYFNKKIEEYYNCEKYINIFPTVLINIDKYLDFNFKHKTENPLYKNHDFDPIHLNTNCSYLIIDLLSENYEIIFKDLILKKHNKFKCYILD